MKSLFVAIALVAACSVANAAEVKKDTTKAPAVSAKAMTDKDMDKVTAGAAPTETGFGTFTAGQARGDFPNASSSGRDHGLGRCNVGFPC